MLPYYLLVAIPLLSLILLTKFVNRETAQKSSLVIFFGLLFLILSLRDLSVGTDINTYKFYFLRIYFSDWKDLASVTDLEIGYVLLNKIVSIFTSDFRWLLVIAAAITLIPICIVYKNETEYSEIMIVLFINLDVFVMMFSGLRQSIAISLGLIAYLFTKSKKWLAFLLTVGVAVTFHYSAVILLFIYPLYHLKMTSNWLYYIIPSYAIIFLFNKYYLALAISFLPERYAKYGISYTGAYTMLILLVIFAIYSFVIPGKNELDKTTTGLRNLLLFSILLQLFVPFNETIMRINYYYLIFIPILIPKIMKQCDSNWKGITKVSYYVMLAFFGVYFFANAYIGEDVLQLFPYKAFWEV